MQLGRRWRDARGAFRLPARVRLKRDPFGHREETQRGSRHSARWGGCSPERREFEAPLHHAQHPPEVDTSADPFPLERGWTRGLACVSASISAVDFENAHTEEFPLKQGLPRAGDVEVFITTDERCGGTALTQIARLLLQGRCVDDPFSNDWLDRDDPDLPCLPAPQGDPAECLERIYRRWRCIKNASTHWPATAYRPLLAAVAERGCRIVFLRRENALQRAISLALAKKTTIFGSYDWTQTPRVQDYAERRVELDVESIAQSVREYQERTADVRALLQAWAPGHLEVRYEDLFSLRNPMEAKFAQLAQLCDHWSVDLGILERQRDDLELILSPSQKMNTPELYRRMVINIDAIANAFDPGRHGDLWANY